MVVVDIVVVCRVAMVIAQSSRNDITMIAIATTLVMHPWILTLFRVVVHITRTHVVGTHVAR